MEREQITTDIENIQDEVDDIGFKGSNEYGLYLRETIVDYIENLVRTLNKGEL